MRYVIAPAVPFVLAYVVILEEYVIFWLMTTFDEKKALPRFESTFDNDTSPPTYKFDVIDIFDEKNALPRLEKFWLIITFDEKNALPKLEKFWLTTTFDAKKAVPRLVTEPFGWKIVDP